MENHLILLIAVGLGISSVSYAKKSIAIARPVFNLSTILAVSVTCLMVSHLVGGHFNYGYVHSHTDSGLPILYRISSLWSGQEGSFMLWMLTICLMGLFLERGIRVMGTGSSSLLSTYSGLASAIALMCFFSKPFDRLAITPADGAGLSEALKDPWMVVHPPLVFIAYSGMAVLAAFSPLVKTKVAGNTLEYFRKWMLFSWIFLGIGIFTGSVWAYRALGWGGYWSWDPIENAALIPWLIMCAYLHSPKGLTAYRTLIPFVLAGAGTFLTRSGLLSNKSAHAYAGGSTIVTLCLGASIGMAFIYLLYTRVNRDKVNNDYMETNMGSAVALNRIPLKPVTCFINLTYLYSFLLLLATWKPLISSTPTPERFFNVSAAIYAASCSILWMIHKARRNRINVFGMITVSTMITLGIIVATRSVDFTIFALIWITALPLSNAIQRNAGKSYAMAAVHLGFFLMIIGVMTSTGLSETKYVLVQPASKVITLENHSLGMKTLLGKESLTVHTLKSDYIIDPGKVQMAGDMLAIPYRTKPLILLFWLGGFVLMGASTIGLSTRLIRLRM